MECGRLWRCEVRLLTAPIYVVVMLSLLCAIGAGVTAAQIPYASPMIRGRVIAENGQPLGGASVLAFWRDSREPDSLLWIHTIHAVETASGPDGSFTIPAWGPKSLPGPVSADSPVLLCYSTGYQMGTMSGGDAARAAVRAEIRMRPLSGAENERVKEFRHMINTLMMVWAPLRGQPNPRMLSAIAADWSSAPEELRTQAPELIPSFDQALQQIRAADGG